MKFLSKIFIGVVAICLTVKSYGQSETYLQAFSSPILLNSGFAGLDKNSNFNTGNQYYHINSHRAYNLFYATYDTYSEKLQGGLGFAFQNGIVGEMNTNISEFTFSYAGFETKLNEGSIRFMANMGISLANKNWFSALLDGLFLDPSEEPSPPGPDFMQYVRIKPGTGFLYRLDDFYVGASAYIPFQLNTTTTNTDESFGRSEEVPYSLSFYLSKKISGFRRGVKSSPMKTSPELFILYNDEFILSRASITISKLDFQYGVFIQNDFTNKVHTLGGNIGYYLNNLCISLNAGTGIPGVSDDIGVCCEMAVSFVIPPILYNEINPFAPLRK